MVRAIAPGIAYITVTTADGNKTNVCKVIVAGGVGVDELESAQEISIYPNPAKDFLRVRTEKYTTSLEVSVFDVTGKLIICKNITILNNSIDIRNLNSGLYLLKINSKENANILKFVKQ